MSHGHARQTEVADFLAGQAVVLLLKLVAPVPDDVAERRNGMRRRESGDYQLARELDLVARFEPVELADHAAAVQALAEELVTARRSLRARGRESPPDRLHVRARVERGVLDPPRVEHGRRPHEPLGEARDEVEP